MNSELFIYPKQAKFNRVIPKNKIYENGKPSRVIRNCFVTQIEQIVWQYKLAPETINLPARPQVPEIEIFSINLKTPDLNENVLRCIDTAIPFPIFYTLKFEGKIKTIAAYKRPSDSDISRWVVDSYFESAWISDNSPRIELPIALDMVGLYEQMLRRLMPLAMRPGETLKTQVDRHAQFRGKNNEYSKLEQRLHREKQFNRKIEMNNKLKILKNEIEMLSQ